MPEASQMLRGCGEKQIKASRMLFSGCLETKINNLFFSESMYPLSICAFIIDDCLLCFKRSSGVLSSPGEVW